jgi:hypothetical protein
VLDVLVADATNRTLRDGGVHRIEAMVAGLGPRAIEVLTAASGWNRSFVAADLVRPGLDERDAEDLVLKALGVGVLRRTRQGRYRLAAEAVGRVLQSSDRTAK